MKKIQIITSLGVLLALLAILVGLPLQVANSAAVTSHKDTLSRLKASTAANHEWQFVSPSGVNATTDTIIYEFDVAGTAFNFGSIALGDIDLLEDTDLTPGDCAGTLTQEVLVSVDTAATNEWLVTINATADTITVGPAAVNDTGAITAANACIILRVGTNASGGVNQITNGAAATYQMGITGTFGDTGETAVTIIADDQVAASATVDEILTFSISNASIAFGTLTTANARWANTTTGSATEVTAHTIVVGTNGQSGFTLTVNGSTLTSGANTITAIGATSAASAPGTEQYGIKATVAGGTGTVSAPYGTANYALDTAAFPDELGAATGATANSTYTLTYIANIGSATEAGSYTSTLTYTATAAF
jgi:hypothetical protein